MHREKKKHPLKRAGDKKKKAYLLRVGRPDKSIAKESASVKLSSLSQHKNHSQKLKKKRAEI